MSLGVLSALAIGFAGAIVGWAAIQIPPEIRNDPGRREHLWSEAWRSLLLRRPAVTISEADRGAFEQTRRLLAIAFWCLAAVMATNAVVLFI